jgi:hypothetical protein
MRSWARAVPPLPVRAEGRSYEGRLSLSGYMIDAVVNRRFPGGRLELIMAVSPRGRRVCGAGVNPARPYIWRILTRLTLPSGGDIREHPPVAAVHPPRRRSESGVALHRKCARATTRYPTGSPITYR